MSFEVKDTGPLSWTVPIVDFKTGRPTPEFQRRWEQQRLNNSLIKAVTLGLGAPTGIPEDGDLYADISVEPFIIYIGSDGAWHSATPIAANPTATASDVAVNGTAVTFMRSDAAPLIQKGLSSQFGIVKVDGTTITSVAGVISAAATATGANPTATAGDVAVNGVATTFMRSDGAPAVQKGSSSAFGIVKVDNTTITAAAGVISGVLASVSDYRSDANNSALGVDTVWDAADYVALTSGTTVNVNFNNGFNFSLLLAHVATLAAPTNMKPGQTGLIAITQDTGGGFTLAYNSAWKFAGGTDPTLSTAAGTIDLLFYEVLPGATTVYGTLVKNVS